MILPNVKHSCGRGSWRRLQRLCLAAGLRRQWEQWEGCERCDPCAQDSPPANMSKTFVARQDMNAFRQMPKAFGLYCVMVCHTLAGYFFRTCQCFTMFIHLLFSHFLNTDKKSIYEYLLFISCQGIKIDQQNQSVVAALDSTHNSCLLFGSHVACGLWPVRTWSDRWFVKWQSKRMNSRHDSKWLCGPMAWYWIKVKSHFVHLFVYHWRIEQFLWFSVVTMGIHCCNFGLPCSVIQMFRSSCCLFSLFGRQKLLSCAGLQQLEMGLYLLNMHGEKDVRLLRCFKIESPAEKEKQWDSNTFDSEICLVTHNSHNTRQNYRDILAFPGFLCLPGKQLWTNWCRRNGESSRCMKLLFWATLLAVPLVRQNLTGDACKGSHKRGSVILNEKLQILWKDEWDTGTRHALCSCANISVILCVCGGQRRKVLVYLC